MINKTEIEKAQNSWGNGIITIGKLKDNQKESRIFTVNFINKHYDFDFGDVLFKPTKASKKQFRNNNKSALSYFIGSDNDYAEAEIMVYDNSDSFVNDGFWDSTQVMINSQELLIFINTEAWK